MAFTCPTCKNVSHNPNDEREGYCGACHDWTGLDPEGDWSCGRCGGRFLGPGDIWMSQFGYGEICLSCLGQETSNIALLRESNKEE